MIVLHCKPGVQLLTELAAAGKIPDFAFLDGPEDPSANLMDFKLLERTVASGCVVVLHDYDVGKRFDGEWSNKCAEVRRYIESSEDWNILHYLTAPVSVGMAVLQKL